MGTGQQLSSRLVQTASPPPPAPCASASPPADTTKVVLETAAAAPRLAPATYLSRGACPRTAPRRLRRARRLARVHGLGLRRGCRLSRRQRRPHCAQAHIHGVCFVLGLCLSHPLHQLFTLRVQELQEAAAASEHACQNLRRAPARLRRRALAAALQPFVLQLLDALLALCRRLAAPLAGPRSGSGRRPRRPSRAGTGAGGAGRAADATAGRGVGRALLV